MTTDEQAIRDRRIAASRDEVVTYRFGPQSSREGRLIDQRVELLAELDRLRGELAAVRELHFNQHLSSTLCDACRLTYPCPTVKLLDGDS